MWPLSLVVNKRKRGTIVLVASHGQDFGRPYTPKTKGIPFLIVRIFLSPGSLCDRCGPIAGAVSSIPARAGFLSGRAWKIFEQPVYGRWFFPWRHTLSYQRNTSRCRINEIPLSSPENTIQISK